MHIVEVSKVRAAIYTRLSVAKEDETATARQGKDCREYATQRGYLIVKEYTDSGASAWSGVERTDFRTMLAAMRDGEFDVLIAWKFDRLTRNLFDYAALQEAAEVHGVRIVGLADGVDTEDGHFTADIHFAVARQESKNISDRVKSKLAENRSKGIPHGGSRAFGYKTGNREVHEVEATVVREMFDRADADEPISRIVDWLNTEGIKTTKGNLWQNSVLRKLLSNPRYVGLYTVEGRVTGDGCWEGIVDPEVFERVGEELRSRTRGPAASRWWLVGIATCGQCGGPMVVNNDRRGKPRYLCNRRGRLVADGSRPCGRVSAGVEYLDPLVLGALSAAVQDTRPPTADGDAETTVLRGELADLQRKIARLSEDRFVREVIDDDDYFPARGLLKDREAGVLSRLHAIRVVPVVEVELGETLLETADRIEGLDLAARRRLVRAVFRTLHVHASEQRGPRFDPERVTFERADAPVTPSS